MGSSVSKKGNEEELTYSPSIHQRLRMIRLESYLYKELLDDKLTKRKGRAPLNNTSRGTNVPSVKTKSSPPAGPTPRPANLTSSR
jgi:hypothetical protein